MLVNGRRMCETTWKLCVAPVLIVLLFDTVLLASLDGGQQTKRKLGAAISSTKNINIPSSSAVCDSSHVLDHFTLMVDVQKGAS